MAADRVPDVIHAYFKAVDDRDFDNLRNLVADDALISTISGPPGEPRSVRTGKQLRREMEDRDPVPWRHRVVDVHVHGAGAIVVGDLVRPETGTQDGFVAFFAINVAGRVAGLKSFRSGHPDVELSAEESEEWSGLVSRVLTDPPAEADPSVDQVVAIMGAAGGPVDEGLTVMWSTRGAPPVAVVGRLGRVAEFAAVVRIEGPGSDPQVAAAWGPLAREERS